jgi:hypothetical protein
MVITANYPLEAVIVRHWGRWAWVWLVGVVLVVGSVTVARTDDEVVDEDDADLDRKVAKEIVDPELNSKLSQTVGFHWVFGPGIEPETARRSLDTLVTQKVAVVDLVCQITEAQRRKLELAGRGDNKRLLDRVADIGRRARLVQGDGIKLPELMSEAAALKGGLKQWTPNEGSLFDKSLKAVLTPEQFASISALREIEQLGGHVSTDASAVRATLEVFLAGSSFSDNGFASLTRLTRMQGLDLSSTDITPAGLAQLTVLTELDWLDLTATDTNDTGLVHVGRLTKLHRLELMQASVTSAGLANLAGLTNLTDLNVSEMGITDAGIAHIARLKKLQSLNLRETCVSDAGLVHLEGLTNLEWLDLSRTGLTDAGLKPLKRLKNLRWLNVNGTEVSDAGVAALKQALPEARIWKRPAAPSAERGES